MDVSREILQYLDYDGGVFIECGANDGITQSNTLFLEQHRNWSGLLIEPSIHAYSMCRINRPKSIVVNTALVSYAYALDHIAIQKGGDPMARVKVGYEDEDGYLSVSTHTLSSLIDENMFLFPHIDFLSLDVEGWACNVLRGIDFKRHRPHFLLVEIQEEPHVWDILKEAEYDFICNLSNFNKKDDPMWDGTHNDFLFKRKW